MSITFEQNMESTTKYIANPRDPPGQKSIYILPGDIHEATYRASTFKDFQDKHINPLKLARSGMYYTGFKDRVKCCSCGMAVENWNKRENIDFSKWHKPDCVFANPNSSGNNSEIHRLSARQGQSSRGPGTSSQSNLSSASNHVPSAGEVLFGDVSSVSSFAPNPLPNPSRSHLPTNSETNHIENNSSEQRDRTALFPCLNPINPHMRNTQRRLQTFADRQGNWPRHRINASPQEIAQAGFFYLGERDRAKCWYCNGGLQNWERNDVAWEEHAKWFPMCEYLLQQKGPQYVHEVVSRHPNLRRPNLHNTPANVPVNLHSMIFRNGPVALSPAALNRRNSGPMIIDPREKLNEQQRKIDEEISSSNMVANAKLMGYSEEVIRAALKRQYELHDDGFTSFESLVDAILSVEEEAEEVTPQKTLVKKAKKSKLENLLEEKLCRICHKNDACIVFLPCGHLACCTQCDEKVKRCPVCNSHIAERIRSYLS